jgi:type II secretory pathway component PulK
VALVIVLIVLALLLTVVGEFGLAMRLEGTTALNFRAAVVCNHLAEAGYHRALTEILPEAIAHHPDEFGLLVFRRNRTEAVHKPDRENIALGAGRFSYRISDEDSRINLNRATPEQLQRLLLELGVPQEARDIIVDSIQDWRDPNDEHRLNGAESDYYEALPVPYKAKNADFDSVEELLLVKGVTPELFWGANGEGGLVDYLTIAGTGQINVNTVSPVILRTLGYAPAEVEVLVKGRPYLDLAALPGNLQGRGRGVALRVVSTTFRVESTGEVPGQGRRTLRAVVQRQGARVPGAAPGRGGTQVAIRPNVRSWQWVEEGMSPERGKAS